jgi:hypothetical protein
MPPLRAAHLWGRRRSTKKRSKAKTRAVGSRYYDLQFLSGRRKRPEAM